jgi:hypothetical protein
LPKFTIRGRTFRIRVQDVETAVTSLQPEPLSRLTPVVKINGKIFPIKQLVAAITGLSVYEVSSLDAYRLLDQLGYFIQYWQ